MSLLFIVLPYCSPRCPHRPLVPTESTAEAYPTVGMPRLMIWIYAGRICNFVGVALSRLICRPQPLSFLALDCFQNLYINDN